MTASQLTHAQIADIIFQRPGRITEGILEQRSLWERGRDYWGTWNNTDRYSYGGFYGSWQEKRRRLFLEFNDLAALKEESPQSLRRAMMELKCVGYSNEQIHEIRHAVLAMAMQYMDNLAGPLEDDLKAYNRDYILKHTDAAFLGTGRFKKEALNEKFEISGQPDEGRFATDEIIDTLYKMCASEGNRYFGVQPQKMRDGLLPK